MATNSELTVFEPSAVPSGAGMALTGRFRGRDVILLTAGADATWLPEPQGDTVGDYVAVPATYANVLAWERRLAPEPRLIAINRAGYRRGFGAGNRIVIDRAAAPGLRYPVTFGGWYGIHAAMTMSAAPFWYIQQSIVRELIPEGVDPADYPGIGHTGGYGPREFLRAGLFAFAGQGGYAGGCLPIGADADHAIVTGHDEESLQASLAFNKLAITEARDYTKFTVDTSQLFGFPVSLSDADRRRVLSVFSGRRFPVDNILPDETDRDYQFMDEEALRLAARYWRACAIHRELYDHAATFCPGRFDYELSLDETPEATPPRDLLFYLVLLEEVFGLPAWCVASAGPNLGAAKRHDFTGSLDWLWRQVNESASILNSRGAMLSVHSADGVNARTGKGIGVDGAILSATGGDCELKVADVYQELLWEMLEHSPEPAERALFHEAWGLTLAAVRLLAAVYSDDLADLPPGEALKWLTSAAGREQVARRHGAVALRLALGAAGYGLPVFKLAAELLPATEPTRPSARAELFRRFMFLTYRELRPGLYATLDGGGWQRLASTMQAATAIRLRAMGWLATDVTDEQCTLPWER